MPRNLKAVLLVVLLTSCSSAQTPDEVQWWWRLREAMVQQTIAEPADGRPPVRDPRVLAAMRATARHEFVPAEQRSHAYEDRALPIGQGQTISQPYIVAIMTELVAPKPEHRVLEVGTGSGYQAAVLSPLVKEVYTIEIIAPLGEAARARLARLGYKNIEVRIGDGYNGWAEKAPFDAIVVTAGAPHVPPALVEQLKPGGRMVIPLGASPYDQNLVVIHKSPDGRDVRRETIMPVMFVPLTGGPKKE